MKKHDYELCDVSYTLSGARFFPSRLRISGKVRIVESIDPGELGKTGKYKGKPTPYGLCIVECTIIGRRKISYMARHLTMHLAYYKAQGLADATFWILWRGIQGNMEFTVSELQRLAEMRVPVAMDYVQMEE